MGSFFLDIKVTSKKLECLRYKFLAKLKLVLSQNSSTKLNHLHFVNRKNFQHNTYPETKRITDDIVNSAADFRKQNKTQCQAEGFSQSQTILMFPSEEAPLGQGVNKEKKVLSSKISQNLDTLK